jgi:hypothetical protein
MKLFGRDVIILRPEVREPVITDQVKNCLDQLHVICQERKLSKNSFYKFILFLNKTTNNHYDHNARELVSVIKDTIHQDVLNEYENYLKTWPLNVSVLQNKAKIYCIQRLLIISLKEYKFSSTEVVLMSNRGICKKHWMT